MTDGETQKVLDELQGVRPEKLNGEAKRLFEAIMKIVDQRNLSWKVQYAMAEYIAEKDIDEDFCPKCKYRNEECNMEQCIEHIVKYFEKEVNSNDR